MAGQGCEPISVNSTLCPHNHNTTDELKFKLYNKIQKSPRKLPLREVK